MNAERDLYNLTLCFPVNSPQYCRLRLLLTYFILFCRTFHNIKNRLQIKISSSLNATEQSLPLNRISLLPLLYGLSYIFFHLWMHYLARFSLPRKYSSCTYTLCDKKFVCLLIFVRLAHVGGEKSLPSNPDCRKVTEKAPKKSLNGCSAGVQLILLASLETFSLRNGKKVLHKSKVIQSKLCKYIQWDKEGVVCSFVVRFKKNSQWLKLNWENLNACRGSAF